MDENISIVIPTYNRGKTLLKVLPSYLYQDNVKEIIIINDASTDRTEEYMLKLSWKEKKIKYYKNPTNLSASASRNIGVSFSNGQYIFFGEDDLLLAKDHLSILLGHMIDNKADIIAGRCISMQPGESNNDALKRADKYKPEPINYKLILTNFQVKTKDDIQLPLLTASMLIKKEVFAKVKYDEYYKRNAWREETDFQLTAGKEGYKLYFCPHSASYHLAKINDRGGARASTIIRYELDMFRFNYYMTKKHWNYIAAHFKVTNIILYMILFIVYILIQKNLFPFLGKIRRLLARPLVRKNTN